MLCMNAGTDFALFIVTLEPLALAVIAVLVNCQSTQNGRPLYRGPGQAGQHWHCFGHQPSRLVSGRAHLGARQLHFPTGKERGNRLLQPHSCQLQNRALCSMQHAKGRGIMPSQCADLCEAARVAVLTGLGASL